MIKELKQLETILSQPITNLTEDQENASYFGFNFQLGKKNIKFRKSRITPKKTGQFVTFWKRDAKGKSIPFTENDSMDCYFIATALEQHSGLFVFPKQTLIDRQILTTAYGEGKRGFRVYPPWSLTENKQATQSKSWQQQYFIDLSAPYPAIKQKLTNILQLS